MALASASTYASTPASLSASAINVSVVSNTTDPCGACPDRLPPPPRRPFPARVAIVPSFERATTPRRGRATTTREGRVSRCVVSLGRSFVRPTTPISPLGDAARWRVEARTTRRRRASFISRVCSPRASDARAREAGMRWMRGSERNDSTRSTRRWRPLERTAETRSAYVDPIASSRPSLALANAASSASSRCVRFLASIASPPPSRARRSHAASKRAR